MPKVSPAGVGKIWIEYLCTACDLKFAVVRSSTTIRSGDLGRIKTSCPDCGSADHTRMNLPD